VQELRQAFRMRFESLSQIFFQLLTSSVLPSEFQPLYNAKARIVITTRQNNGHKPVVSKILRGNLSIITEDDRHYIRILFTVFATHRVKQTTH
jgi:hypothetical protein